MKAKALIDKVAATLLEAEAQTLTDTKSDVKTKELVDMLDDNLPQAKAEIHCDLLDRGSSRFPWLTR